MVVDKYFQEIKEKNDTKEIQRILNIFNEEEQGMKKEKQGLDNNTGLLIILSIIGIISPIALGEKISLWVKILYSFPSLVSIAVVLNSKYKFGERIKRHIIGKITLFIVIICFLTSCTSILIVLVNNKATDKDMVISFLLAVLYSLVMGYIGIRNASKSSIKRFFNKKYKYKPMSVLGKSLILLGAALGTLVQIGSIFLVLTYIILGIITYYGVQFFVEYALYSYLIEDGITSSV